MPIHSDAVSLWALHISLEDLTIRDEDTLSQYRQSLTTGSLPQAHDHRDKINTRASSYIDDDDDTLPIEPILRCGFEVRSRPEQHARTCNAVMV